MEPSSLLIGIVGKTNIGKSTFFSAATEIVVPIENRPFVTIDPNVGMASVRKICPHAELGLPRCDARNSACVRGNRLIPVKIMDVAGLVRGAHAGRGLGNRFLDHLRRADVLLLVVDVSGSTDEEGRPLKPGAFDPLEEAIAMMAEIDEWLYSIISKDWDRLARQIESSAADPALSIAQRLSGLGVTKAHVQKAIEASGLSERKLSSWRPDDLRRFTKSLREASKPIVVVANKSDIAPEGNLERLRDGLKGYPVIRASALYELVLRKSASKGIIDYLPGDSDFSIKRDPPSPELRKMLDKIRDYLNTWKSTGVQEAINEAVLGRLNMIAVYPVEDHNKYSDGEGKVLPDVLLVPKGSTARDVAFRIHTDLGATFLYAINAKTKQRVGESYEVRDNDIIKIVATAMRT